MITVSKIINDVESDYTCIIVINVGPCHFVIYIYADIAEQHSFRTGLKIHSSLNRNSSNQSNDKLCYCSYLCFRSWIWRLHL